MNLGQIKTSVQRFGFDANDPIVDWANEAYIEFWDAFDWPWKKTEVTGVMTVGVEVLPTTPTNSEVPYSLAIAIPGSNTLLHPLTYMNYREYQDTDIYSTSGFPQTWTRVGNNIRVSPPSDTAYSYVISYDLIPTTLSADVDVPLIPARYHYTLVRGAAAIGLETENQEDRAAAQWDKFEDRIEKLKSVFTEQKGTFSRIRNVRH